MTEEQAFKIARGIGLYLAKLYIRGSNEQLRNDFSTRMVGLDEENGICADDLRTSKDRVLERIRKGHRTEASFLQRSAIGPS